MNQTEFETLILDQTKHIPSDIFWSDDDDHSPCQEFRAVVISSPRYPLFVKGSYNIWAGTLSYALVYQGYKQIYLLDMEQDHDNPCCTFVGEIHKHHRHEQTHDKEAYIPPQINPTVCDPLVEWHQFCTKVKITHHGMMYPPLPVQSNAL